MQKVSDLDHHPDGVRDLLKAYLQTGRIGEAGPLAVKLFSEHSDAEAMFAYIDGLVQNGGQEEALEVIDQHSDRLLAENSAKVLETLRAVIGPVGSSPAALEKLLELFQKAGDQSHVSEVNELLAHACVQSGDLARARDLYQSLAENEPQNAMHMQNYQQVVGMMGGSAGTKLLSVEEGIILVEELEATAPPVDQPYSPEVAAALRAALTDTELFISYNMPDKALGPLMAVLPIAPQDVRLNQRLAALYTRSERFADAAACCRTLATVYSEAGLAEEASRYEDLARRCGEHAGTQPSRPPAPGGNDAAEIPLAPWPLSASDSPGPYETAEPEISVVDETEPAQFAVTGSDSSSADEIDLSGEWEGALSEGVSDVPDAPAVQPAVEEISAESSDAVAETIEEIRFYLEHSMVDQARAAYVKLQSQTADYEQLAAIQAEIDAVAPAPVPADPEPAEIAVAEDEALPEAEPASSLEQMVAELDSSLGDGFLSDTPAHEIEQEQDITAQAATDPALVSHLEFMSGPKLPAQKPVEPEPAPGVLSEFVADLEDALGDGFLQDAPVKPAEHPEPAPAVLSAEQTAPAAAHPELHMAASAVTGSGVTHAPIPVPPPPAPAGVPEVQTAAGTSTFRTSVRPVNAANAKQDLSASVDLADMFGEIRHELEEEVATAEEDPETHYNLGVAFREMGLLDEAIGEFRKVCQAIDHGHSFPQVMQTYTWLAQCFLDKGVPEAAIRWYEKALKLPALDQETRTALHYELASSYEPPRTNAPPCSISWKFTAATSTTVTWASASRP